MKRKHQGTTGSSLTVAPNDELAEELAKICEKAKYNNSCPIQDAIRSDKREAAFQMIRQGFDPFKEYDRPGVYYYRTSFHAAIARDDIEMLLAMAAKPGTRWRKCFSISQGQVIDVPVEGRAVIATRGVLRQEKDFRGFTFSLQGAEAMAMCGYWRNVADHDWHSGLSGDIRILKFYLAAGKLTAGDRGKNCILGAACRSKFDWVRLLLQAGIKPCSYDIFLSAINIFARCDKKKHSDELAKLLVTYGIDILKDISEAEHVARRVDEVGMRKALTLPEHPIIPDPEACIRDCRLELEAPLRREVCNISGSLVVAMMRSTGSVPPAFLMSQLILDYCPFGFDLWKVESSATLNVSAAP